MRELTNSLQNSKAERDRATLQIDKEKAEHKIAQDKSDHLTKKLQAKLEDLERLLETSGRQSTAGVASLYSQIEQLLREIERLQRLLDAETARRLELAAALRLAEESIRRAKLVGIGMRITDEAPHRITEIVAGGAAHMSGALQVNDYVLTATRCNTLQNHCESHMCSVLQIGDYVLLLCNTLQQTTITLDPTCLARCRSVDIFAQQHTATDCDTLCHTAPHCNTLQHTATH